MGTSFRDEFQPGELLYFQIMSIIYTIMGIVSLICVQGQAQTDEKLPPRKQTKIERYCSVFIQQFVILIFIGGILGLCAFFVPITDENKFRLKGAFVCMIVFCMIFTIPIISMYICSIHEFVMDMKQWKHKKLSSIMVEVMVFFITELGTVIDDFFCNILWFLGFMELKTLPHIMTMTQ